MDKKAIRILMNAYWSSEGWKMPRVVDREDLNYAIEAGVMFRPPILGHGDIVDLIRQHISDIKLIDVSNAFLASLSSRRLELRSALGSYACGLNFPDHEYQPSQFQANVDGCVYTGSLGCRVCYFYNDEPQAQDVDVLNFERYKWGGVRHLDPLYIAFDLHQFKSLDKPEPTPEDFRIMNNIIETMYALPTGARASTLEKSLAGIVKSNEAERRILIQILGFCGILETKKFPGPATKFISHADRPWPPTGKNDWEYPASWWTRAEGINSAALAKFFPQDGILRI